MAAPESVHFSCLCPGLPGASQVVARGWSGKTKFQMSSTSRSGTVRRRSGHRSQKSFMVQNFPQELKLKVTISLKQGHLDRWFSHPGHCRGFKYHTVKTGVDPDPLCADLERRSMSSTRTLRWTHLPAGPCMSVLSYITHTPIFSTYTHPQYIHPSSVHTPILTTYTHNQYIHPSA